MNYNFDEIIDRKPTSAVKWDRYRGTDILPLWVADMDFKAPPAVIEALHQRVEHGIYGYTWTPQEVKKVIVERLRFLYQWDVMPGWLVWLPGAVPGIHISCRFIGESGDEVITQTPIYPPFLEAPELSDRKLLCLPLLRDQNGRWGIDFEALKKLITPRTKVFLLCNPHNPTGTVFTKEELTKLANLCEKHDILICSDELHCELILDKDKQHIPIATLAPEVAKRTITLLSPSKTFNLAGFGFTFAVIPDFELRKKFIRSMTGVLPYLNALSYTAALAAYRDSEDWLKALLDYLRENREFLKEQIGTMPKLSMDHVESTYLAWINAEQLDMENPALFFEKAGVGLSPGKDFGMPPYVRLNFACPRPILTEALKRMKKAMAN